MNKRIERVDPTALRLLMEYHWPGNVRELENLIDRAMIVASGDTLHIEPQWLEPVRTAKPKIEPQPSTWDEIQRHTILDALQRCGGRIYGANGAAAVLGVKPTTLYGRMRKYGITRPSPP
jgi:formate hydrogenlyase transcriptional activator